MSLIRARVKSRTSLPRPHHNHPIIRPSVFQRSQSLLVRWGDAWGCGGWRAAAWASFGRGQLQQACGFTAV